MSSKNSNLGLNNISEVCDTRAEWERPVLRRLAANQAAGGPGPCNDGTGGGCGPAGQHPSA
jgi:hypothetical protein